MNLTTPVERIPGIGSFHQARLKRLKIKTLGELLFYFPNHYEDFSDILNIKNLKFNQKACIKAKIKSVSFERSYKKRMHISKALLEDESGSISAVWFNQPYLEKTLKEKDELILWGKLTFQGFAPSSFEKIKEKELNHLGRIVGIYPETAGLTSRWLRYILKPLVTEFSRKIPETLPEEILKKYDLLDFKTAFYQIHFPDSIQMAEKAKKRFAFEEIFFISLFSMKKKKQIQEENAQSIPINNELIKRFEGSLPFKLTSAQQKALKDIYNDLKHPYPMNRLLQGDVGSGKTVVASLASLLVVKAGYQVVMMAPTEILAKQHFKTMFEMLKRFNLDIGLLTGKSDKFYSRKLANDTIEISRQKLLKKIEKGEIDILIGTHALIAPTIRKTKNKIIFNKLGLVIVDEQHRFGVEQRKALTDPKTNKKTPHLLSMTATPIPRSLALTLWGDLDISIIDEMPKGRKKVKTKIIYPDERKKLYEAIRKEIKNKRQCFVICPRIEEDEKSELKAVKEEYEKLAEEIFPDLIVDMLHGKMSAKEKDEIMRDFKNRKADILVSTSVIEVGIDIENATIMAIEGADRFGLAQLHQFRGRVGRGDHQSYCFLLTDSLNKKTQQRLNALIKTNSGFKLSEMDLKLRGPGSFLGVKQWGLPDFAMTALRDEKLVKKTKEACKAVFSKLKKYPLLKRRLEAFEEKIHFE